MINAVTTQLLKFITSRLRVMLVLVLTLMIGGLPSHIASSHATPLDSQTVAVDDGEDHTHEEPDGAVKHSGHDHGQDATDHSHQLSLTANCDAPLQPDITDCWQTIPQETFRGSARFDIDKPPKRAAVI